MRKRLLFMFLLSLLAVGAMAQVRGTGRLTGIITAKDTGKPIAGATITISLPGGRTEPIIVKTDSHGRWAALGMTPGQWYVDISASGYATSKGTANISELTMTPTIKTELTPEVKVEATAPVTPAIPPEGVAAIKEGEALLKVKTGDTVSDTTTTTTTTATTTAPHTVTREEVKANAKQAAADFEKALPMIDESKPGMKEIKNQVYQVLAQAYYRAGDIPSAITTFETLNQRDPAPTPPDQPHVTRDVLLANLYLENGQLDKGRALLDALPPTAITDPTAYINIGILFLNKKDPASAVNYFTKAVDLDPKQVDPYYYRGLAEVQQAQTGMNAKAGDVITVTQSTGSTSVGVSHKLTAAEAAKRRAQAHEKLAQAKADFQQVLALAAPDSSEAHDAKQLLAGLK